MLTTIALGTKCHFLCVGMIFLIFLVFNAGTFAKFTFTNYGMKRLLWRNAKKKFVRSNNEKISGPLKLYCGTWAEIIRNFKILS